MIRYIDIDFDGRQMNNQGATGETVHLKSQETPYYEVVDFSSPTVNIVGEIRDFLDFKTETIDRFWQFYTPEEMAENYRIAEQKERLRELFEQRNNPVPMNRAARRAAKRRK